MIVARLDRADFHAGRDARLDKALDYLVRTDFAAVAPGRYAIDGEDVFAIVQDYETRPRNSGIWEVHRRHIDVQFLVEGSECIGYAPTEDLAISRAYSEEEDCMFLQGSGSFVTMHPGMFMVLGPEDAHMPCCAVDVPASVRKVVVKIRI